MDINPGKSTPKIILDENAGKVIIEGQSYPENAGSFYAPIVDWIKDYISQDGMTLEMVIKLIYINTSSTQVLMYILDIFEEAYSQGKRLSVKWYYDPENELAKETGEELREDLTIPFEVLPA